MTIAKINQKAKQAMTKYEIAAKIRELLDSAAKTMGDDYDEDEILELVTEE